MGLLRPPAGQAGRKRSGDAGARMGRLDFVFRLVGAEMKVAAVCRTAQMARMMLHLRVTNEGDENGTGHCTAWTWVRVVGGAVVGLRDLLCAGGDSTCADQSRTGARANPTACPLRNYCHPPNIRYGREALLHGPMQDQQS